MSRFAPLSAAELAKAQDAAPANTPAREAVIPVPADAPVMEPTHSKHGRASAVWTYHTPEGGVVGHVLRFDIMKDGKPAKVVLPRVFCREKNGRSGWQYQGFPQPYPLYRQPDFVARPDAPVLVVEGEKTADAAARLLPDYVCTTSPHGSQSARKADWSLLKGRLVVIAPDADEPGEGYLRDVAEAAREAGATEVRVLRPRDVRADAPDGWDLADALTEGISAEALVAAITPYQFGGPGPDEDHTRAHHRMPCGPEWLFRRTPDGVLQLQDRRIPNTRRTERVWVWICSPIEVVAETRSFGQENWGRLVELKDGDGQVKQVVLSASLLADRGTGFLERLLNLGLRCDPAHLGVLRQYLMLFPTDDRIRVVESVGWHGDAFVLPDAVYTPEPSEETRHA